MNFIIPMAGDGSRFKDQGYLTPKWQLAAHGRTLLEWSVSSLPLELCTNLIFVARTEAARDLINQHYGIYKPEILVLPGVTRGQAETVLKAERFLDESLGTIIFNIDTAFTSDTLIDTLSKDYDGVLGSFASSEPRFSFAKETDGVVTEVVEKIPISSNALTGLYHFRNTGEMLGEIKKMITDGFSVRGEFYIAPVYQRLITKGRKFVLDRASTVTILGTPEEYESFIEAGRRREPSLSGDE